MGAPRGTIAVCLATAAVVVATGGAHSHSPQQGGSDALPPLHWATALVALSGAVYGIGLRRLWAHAGPRRGIAARQAAAFGLGIALLFAALSPHLEQASEHWLVAHMAKHVLLVAFVPALLVLGRPDVAYAWAVPANWRSMYARRAAPGRAGRAVAARIRPVPAALVHAGAMWAWHVPAAYEAALQSRLLHDLEHLAFFATAMLFWHSVARAVRLKDFLGAMSGLLIVMIQGGFLGALLAFAGRPLYGVYTGSAGLSALHDQHLAGLVMWVPMGAICLAAALVVVDRMMPGTDGTKSPVRSSRPSSP